MPSRRQQCEQARVIAVLNNLCGSAQASTQAFTLQHHEWQLAEVKTPFSANNKFMIKCSEKAEYNKTHPTNLLQFSPKVVKI